jgi:hypothetical protein
VQLETESRSLIICTIYTDPPSQKTQAGSKSLESALKRMENDVMRIRATSLRELLGMP